MRRKREHTCTMKKVVWSSFRIDLAACMKSTYMINYIHADLLLLPIAWLLPLSIDRYGHGNGSRILKPWLHRAMFAWFRPVMQSTKASSSPVSRQTMLIAALQTCSTSRRRQVYMRVLIGPFLVNGCVITGAMYMSGDSHCTSLPLL